MANSYPQTKHDLLAMHLKSRRVWVGVLDPTTPHRHLDEEAQNALTVWSQLLRSTPFQLSMQFAAMIKLQQMLWPRKRLQVVVVLLSFTMESDLLPISNPFT